MGYRMGQTYSAIPNDSNMRYMKKNVPPRIMMMPKTTLAQM
jgi:hypothetical protein